MEALESADFFLWREDKGGQQQHHRTDCCLEHEDA
jgi:hypothetical protein